MFVRQRCSRLGSIPVSLMLALLFIIAASAAQQTRQGSSTSPRPTPTPNDIRIKQRMKMGEAMSLETTTLIKGLRERKETKMQMQGMETMMAAVGGSMNLPTITQCDLKRTITINDNARKYMAQPFDQSSSEDTSASRPETTTERTTPAASRPSGPVRRGGIITYTTTITDTGERKQMFGFTARHLKTSMSSESSPDACAQQKMRIDTDGWYIDLDYGLNCPTERVPPQVAQRRERADCQDQIRFKAAGGGKRGFPLTETTTIYNPDGSSTSIMTTEVIELSRAALDSSLFDIPAGYAEVKSFEELAPKPSMEALMKAAMKGGSAANESNRATGTSSGSTASASVAVNANPKSPGAVRIGVVAIDNKAGRPVSTDSLRERLIGSISGSNIEAIPLAASSPAEAEAEAKQKDCDLVLYTSIASMKQSAAGKVGGFLGRAAGVGSMGAGKTESRVDFRLVPVGSATPQLESSATAKEDGDEESVGAALERAAKAVSAAARNKK